MDIIKQFSVLEDIYRLIVYLDWLAHNDKLHFCQSGYSPKFESDYALQELKLKIKLMMPIIVDSYFLSIDDISETEKRDLHEWIADGNSIFENPYLFSDEDGRPMDFVSACRFNGEMYEDFLNSRENEVEVSLTDCCYDGCNDDLPF
jgi:hypothetical protein